MQGRACQVGLRLQPIVLSTRKPRLLRRRPASLSSAVFPMPRLTVHDQRTTSFTRSLHGADEQVKFGATTDKMLRGCRRRGHRPASDTSWRVPGSMHEASLRAGSV